MDEEKRIARLRELGLKLDWQIRKEADGRDDPSQWRAEAFPETPIITILVRCPSKVRLPSQFNSHVPEGQWELILGDCFWSRDKDRYFKKAADGMIVAEKLVGKFGDLIKERLGG